MASVNSDQTLTNSGAFDLSTTTRVTPPLIIASILAVLFIIVAFSFLKFIFEFKFRYRSGVQANIQDKSQNQSNKDAIAGFPILVYGFKPVGITTETISSSSSSPPPSIDDGQNDSCAICLEDYETGDVIRVLPSCKHMFHMDCIDQWLGIRSLYCPICRDMTIDGGDESKTEGRSGENDSGGSPMGIPNHAFVLNISFRPINS